MEWTAVKTETEKQDPCVFNSNLTIINISAFV